MYSPYGIRRPSAFATPRRPWQPPRNSQGEGKMMKNVRLAFRFAAVTFICFALYVATSGRIVSHNRQRRSVEAESVTVTMGAFTPISTAQQTPNATISKPKFDGLKIYIYKLLPSMGTELLDTVIESDGEQVMEPDLDCRKGPYKLEYTFHQYLKLQKGVITENPEEADFFYVPAYISCHFALFEHQLNETNLYMNNVLEHIRKMPYWDRSQGRDHIWVMAHDRGASIYTDWVKISSSIFLVQNGQLGLAHYRHGKDIVIPNDFSDMGFLPIFMKAENLTWPSPRKNLALYHTDHTATLTKRNDRGHIYSRGVTLYLEDAFREHPNVLVGWPGPNPEKEIKNSTFCLAPEGWYASTYRPYKATLLGCIPVVISEEVVLAFESTVDWERMAIFVHPSDVVNLHNILNSISEFEIEVKQEALRDNWRYLWYGEGGKAMDVVMQTLADRRKIIGPRRLFRTAPIV
eukprot:comp22336_c3_seq1/m.33218 comp22336_c3_seq1/g.33218  ORF comp22336_c3_seq1/g.33218 comp22336_c3_seq1/m.33218 type:complete len:462 (-) comp22336_c3_seq1:197-1582(-)